MEVTANATDILKRRYMNKGEAVEERFWAVANRHARCEERFLYWAKTFYDELLEPLNFLPNSPAIKNARVEDACLSACHVMSPKDNLESIYQVERDAGMVIASGGGVGHGLSNLREAGSPVNNVQGVACGPIGVLRMYSENSNQVSQAFRKGANMAQLAIDHPDIREFIHVKDNHTSVNNFNLSVQVPDDFMETVAEGDGWDLLSRHPDHKWSDAVDVVDARGLWQEICESAWKTGDPGLVFIDRVNDTHPNFDRFGPIESSNPCGEEFLEDYGSCCLGSIDISKHLNADRTGIDWTKLKRTVTLAVRFLDNSIDVNFYKVDKSREMAEATRRIGLGIMGWADALSMLGIVYGSGWSINLAERVGLMITQMARGASAALAREKGPYPGQTRYRNSSVTTFAPTGTISRLADCSSGIEPHFAHAWQSKILWDANGAQVEHFDMPKSLREALGHIYIEEDDKDALMGGVASARQHLERLQLYPDLWLTSGEIHWTKHIHMLAAFQKYVTNSISKTINLPEDATVEDISGAFLMAYELGCKAITVYRDKSRSVQVLNKSEVKSAPAPAPVEKQHRPQRLAGSTYRVPTGHGTMYLTVNADEMGAPKECFVNLGKSGNCTHTLTEAMGRLITIALQHGVAPADLYDQLVGISCSHTSYNSDGTIIKSIPDGIASVLAQFLTGNMLAEYVSKPTTESMCTECGGMTVRYDGCETCQSCGNQLCG